MFKKVSILLMLASLLLVALPAAAQDGSSEYEFSDGTTITVPEGWTLDEVESDPEGFARYTNDEVTLEVVLFSTELQAAFGLPEDAGIPELIDLILSDNEAPVDYEIETIELEDAEIFSAAYVDEDEANLIYGIALDSGAFLLANFMGTADGIDAADVLEGVLLSATDTTPDGLSGLFGGDGEGDPDEPVLVPLEDLLGVLPTIDAIETYEFSDATIMRYPAFWTLTPSEDVPDLIEFTFDDGQVFGDLYTVDNIETLELEAIEDVMAFSYIPFDPEFEYDPEAITVAALNDVPVYFYRYVDGGTNGTQMAVELPNGSILVMDAFLAEPESSTEAIVFAILVDAAGESTLFDSVSN